MGSKSRIVDKILPIMLESPGNTFVDMFCGSCSVIQKVPNTYKRIANDANPYLVQMWKQLTKDSTEFPTEIPRYLYNHWRDLYNQHKKNKVNLNHTELGMTGWIGFMGSYNGRFFDGGYSGHEVKGRDYIGENIRNTLSQIPELKDVQFSCSQYMDYHFTEPSIIYCDPPYKGVKNYTYSIDHDYFWEWCREMTRQGHKVFISEYNAPDDFECIWQQELTNAMHQTNTKKPIEKLFIFKS